MVEALALSALAAPERQEILSFQKKAGELQRAMYGAGEALSEALNRLQFIKKAIQDAPAADLAWGDEARAMEKQLQQFKTELILGPDLGQEKRTAAAAAVAAGRSPIGFDGGDYRHPQAQL